MGSWYYFNLVSFFISMLLNFYLLKSLFNFTISECNKNNMYTILSILLVVPSMGVLSHFLAQSLHCWQWLLVMLYSISWIYACLIYLTIWLIFLTFSNKILLLVYIRGKWDIHVFKFKQSSCLLNSTTYHQYPSITFIHWPNVTSKSLEIVFIEIEKD